MKNTLNTASPRVFGSIKNRLSAVMLITFIVIITINVFIIFRINTSVSRIDAVFSSNVTIGELTEGLDRVQKTVYDYLNTKSTYALENYYRYEQDYRDLLEQLNNQNIGTEPMILEKNIRNMSESFLLQTQQTVQAKRGRNVEKYRESYEKETELYRYINNYIYQLNAMQFRLNSERYKVLLNSLKMLEQFSVVILVVISTIALMLIYWLIHQMVQPLTALSESSIQVAGGNLDVPLLPVVYQDEVGSVTNGFNQMLVSIRQYIIRLRESLEKEASLKSRQLSMEAHLKEAQLNYLQAQINPHFLFNSLNAGMQLAMLEDAEKTTVFLEKMADFFRYNVHKMGEDTTLSEELETVDSYIYILNVRYAGDLTYYKEVEEGFDNIRVPSMILQPIVENAVQHGIRDCMEDGWIRLKLYREDAYLSVIVEDNGAGMTQEQIRKILNKPIDYVDPQGSFLDSEEPRRDSKGIAMENVIHRLQIYYDQDQLLTIESDGAGTGTKVTIRLPLEGKQNHEETE